MRLSGREQWMVVAAVGFVVVVGLGNYVVGPLLDRNLLLERKVAQKRQELSDFSSLEVELTRLTERYQAFEERGTRHKEGFSLYVELEVIAQRADVKDKIDAYKPAEHPVGDYREQTVDMDLKGLTLEDLGRLLRDIERSRESLYVKRIEVSQELRGRDESGDRLKVKLVVGTLVGKVS